MKKAKSHALFFLFFAILVLVSLLFFPVILPILLFPWLIVTVEEKLKHRFHIPVGRYSKVVSVTWICLSTIEMFFSCFLISIGNLMVLLIALLIYLLLSFLILYRRCKLSNEKE